MGTTPPLIVAIVVQNDLIFTEQFHLIGSNNVAKPKITCKNWHQDREGILAQDWIAYENSSKNRVLIRGLLEVLST